MSRSDVGETVRRARAAAGMTQGQLAKRCGTAQSAISRIEKNHVSPSVSTLERILEATGSELVLWARRAGEATEAGR